MAGERKAALVTGAASGIGRATCERMAASGWDVLGVDRDCDALGWAEGVSGIRTIVADVASSDDNARAAAEAEAAFGRLDALVLNAGMNGVGRIDELDWDEFQRVIAVNMAGPVLGIRAALPLLRRQAGAAIVVTASIMGVGGDQESWAYAMTKHAVIGLVRALARELGPEGLRINALCPGLTRTTMTGVLHLTEGRPPPC